MDTPGWSDADGKIRSLQNLLLIYKELSDTNRIGKLNVLALAVNEQDRFDESIQDFVLRLY
jgi:hypothetical protein